MISDPKTKPISLWLHPRCLSHGRRKEDMMEAKKPAVPSLEETISEIASILAEGYLRYRKRRCLPASDPDIIGQGNNSQQSDYIGDISLDSSDDIGLVT
jgi:hypothetical protein